MLQDFKKHLMTGISYMIPMVVAGGILGALAKGLGGWEVGNLAPDASGATIFSYLNAFDWGQFWWAISKLSDFAMSFACAVLAAGIAYSMSERPGIVPAFILGYTANQAKAGFIGALILGFIVGWLVNVFKKYGEKLPKALQGLLPVLIIPVFVTFIVGALFFMLLMGPMTAVMTAIQNWIMSLMVALNSWLVQLLVLVWDSIWVDLSTKLLLWLPMPYSLMDMLLQNLQKSLVV